MEGLQLDLHAEGEAVVEGGLTLEVHLAVGKQTGRTEVAALERKATTRGRKAELLYYSAVLDDAIEKDQMRAVLQTVVKTEMVLFYEYDMAKYWLAEGFVARGVAGQDQRPSGK